MIVDNKIRKLIMTNCVNNSIAEIPTSAPTLLLHACCAPCSIAVYEKLCSDFNLTVFWYNPNIFPLQEHDKRLNEIKKLSKILGFKLIISLGPNFDHQKWLEYRTLASNGTIEQLSNSPEGGPRCWLCYQMRLEKVVQYAIDHDFDYFSTTLTISPHKNGPKIMAIGQELERQSKIKFLSEDFKKSGGYQRSIELSKEYKLYRQNYCGCEYALASKPQRQKSVNEP